MELSEIKDLYSLAWTDNMFFYIATTVENSLLKFCFAVLIGETNENTSVWISKFSFKNSSRQKRLQLKKGFVAIFSLCVVAANVSQSKFRFYLHSQIFAQMILRSVQKWFSKLKCYFLICYEVALYTTFLERAVKNICLRPFQNYRDLYWNL